MSTWPYEATHRVGAKQGPADVADGVALLRKSRRWSMLSHGSLAPPGWCPIGMVDDDGPEHFVWTTRPTAQNLECMELSQLKQQLTLELMNDARIFAAHRENNAPSTLAKGHKRPQHQAAVALAPSDLRLSSQKHGGAKWRPPPKQVITGIAEELNMRPLSPARAH